MASHDTPSSPITSSWVMVISNGLAIGMAIPFGEHLRQLLTPALGSPWAFTISLVAVGALGGVVGLVGEFVGRRVSRSQPVAS